VATSIGVEFVEHQNSKAAGSTAESVIRRRPAPLSHANRTTIGRMPRCY